MNKYILTLIPVVCALVSALIAVRWVYFKILYIAKEKNIVDNPDARKLQKTPIPVTGGLAVFFGVAMGLLAGYTIGGLIGVHFTFQLMPILAAVVVMLYVGTMDDIIGLTPKDRFIIEGLAVLGLIFASRGCIDNFHGLWGIWKISWWFAVPMTVFAGVGIINGVNLVDGVNGLSSTLCMISSALYGFIFVRSGDVANATLAFTVAGSLVPFILHNVFGLKSRMFIGDAGTMAMGILLTWFTICMLRSNSPITYYDTAKGINMIAFALSVLCVPVFDTLRVMIMRMVRKQNPFHPDKTHLHHIFVRVGISHAVTTLIEVLILFSVLMTWAICVKVGVNIEWQLYIVIAISILLIWGSYGFLSYHIYHRTTFYKALISISPYTHLGRTNWWKRFTAILDAPEKKQLKENQETEARYASKVFNDSPIIILEKNAITMDSNNDQQNP